MKSNNIIKILISIIICELAGVAGSFFSTPEINGWYRNLDKPALTPPAWMFGPVWTLLFVLMGVSLYLVWSKNWVVNTEKTEAKLWNPLSQKLWTGSWSRINIISIFCLQLILNVLWSVIFFRIHSPAWAFFELLMLWFAILFTIINFYRVSRAAAYLLIPYILWVSFAGVLNYFLWTLNLLS